MTSPPAEPGDRRPLLDRPPGERYAPVETGEAGQGSDLGDPRLWALAVVLGTLIAFTFLGGFLTVTAGLIVIAGFAGWLLGKLVSPPPRAAVVALLAVAAGFLGIWLFGRMEGGVLGPLEYLDDVEGPVVVALSLLAGAGFAAASSR